MNKNILLVSFVLALGVLRGDESASNAVIKPVLAGEFGAIFNVEGVVPAESFSDLPTKIKNDNVYLSIDVVNGRTLDKAITVMVKPFNVDVREKLEKILGAGSRIELVVYESVQASGVPHGAEKYVTVPQSTMWEVEQYLVILRIQKIEPQKKKWRGSRTSCRKNPGCAFYLGQDSRMGVICAFRGAGGGRASVAPC